MSTTGVSPSEEGALEWVRLDESIAADAPSSADTSLAAVRLKPIRHVADLAALKASFDAEAERDMAEANVAADVLSDRTFGQYVGQINARIDRAWLRPRSPIGDDRFVCQVRIEQDATGRVKEVALERCNGSPRWQISLVRAIESASPLPPPTDPAVFAHAIHMSFEAVPAESAVSLEQYESSSNLPHNQ